MVLRLFLGSAPELVAQKTRERKRMVFGWVLAHAVKGTELQNLVKFDKGMVAESRPWAASTACRPITVKSTVKPDADKSHYQGVLRYFSPLPKRLMNLDAGVLCKGTGPLPVPLQRRHSAVLW